MEIKSQMNSENEKHGSQARIYMARSISLSYIPGMSHDRMLEIMSRLLQTMTAKPISPHGV